MPNNQHLNLKTALTAQVEEQPPSGVKACLMSEIQKPAKSWRQPALKLATGLALVFLLILTISFVVKPFLVSVWNNQSSSPSMAYHKNHNEPAAIILSDLRAWSTFQAIYSIVFGIITIFSIVSTWVMQDKNSISKTCS